MSNPMIQHAADPHAMASTSRCRKASQGGPTSVRFTYRFASPRAAHESCQHAWTEVSSDAVEQLELATFATRVWHIILHGSARIKWGEAVLEAINKRASATKWHYGPACAKTAHRQVLECQGELRKA